MLRCRWCHDVLHNTPAPDGKATWVDSTGGDVCGTREAQDETVTGTNPDHVPMREEVTLQSDNHRLTIRQNENGFFVLTSNLRDGEPYITEEDRLFAAMVDGVECTLLALYEEELFDSLTEDRANFMFQTICDALSNHS